GDVPGKFESGLGVGVGPIVVVMDRDGFDDVFGNAMFVFERTQQNVVQPELGVFDRHGLHRGSSWLGWWRAFPILVAPFHNPAVLTDAPPSRAVIHTEGYGSDRPAWRGAPEYSTLRAQP